MKTKTTLLGILGLATVAGAGYFYTSDQDMSEIPQQVGQYLPEAVLDYLPQSFSPEATPAAVAASNAAVVNHDADDQTAGSDEATQAQDVADMTKETSQQTEASPDEAAGQEAVQAVEGATDTDQVAMDAEVMNEIEQSVADVSAPQAVEKTADSVIKDPKESKEAQALQQKIKEVNSKLAELDSEKEMLEERFQKVLKQNRTLAMKLKEIDEQLKVKMK
jgi:chromosome segregation ATPase